MSDAADALLILAAERPWRHISLRDVAEKAGIPLVELYAETPSKNALLARLSARGQAADRYERLGAPFFTRIRDGFLEVAADNPTRCVLVPAETDMDSLAATLRAIVDQRFPQ